jgi:indole-3-glycerol phosphate synthase
LRSALLSHPTFAIIAEIKRHSPSAGRLASDIVLSEIAAAYEAGGAAAISVLTDAKYFGGSIDDLSDVRASTSLPLLRKDFTVDEYQIVEARAHGADAILLIAAILEKNQLRDMFGLATELGMDCLVELNNLTELDILDPEVMHIVGINNRDLRTMSVDVSRTLEMVGHLPSHAVVVSESGIRTGDELRTLQRHGVHAALIGEHFMRSSNPGTALATILEDARR